MSCCCLFLWLALAQLSRRNLLRNHRPRKNGLSRQLDASEILVIALSSSSQPGIAAIPSEQMDMQKAVAGKHVREISAYLWARVGTWYVSIFSSMKTICS